MHVAVLIVGELQLALGVGVADGDLHGVFLADPAQPRLAAVIGGFGQGVGEGLCPVRLLLEKLMGEPYGRECAVQAL